MPALRNRAATTAAEWPRRKASQPSTETSGVGLAHGRQRGIMSAGEISDWGKRKLPFEVNVLTVSIVCFTVLVVATVFHLRRKKKKLSGE